MNSRILNTVNDSIDRFGKDVIIIDKSPRIKDGKVEKTDRNRPIYDISQINTRARIKEMKGNEKIVQNAILDVNDAIGLFKFDVGRYIKQGNELSVTHVIDDDNSVTNRYTMLKPSFKQTHIEVNLKQREVT